MRTSLTRALAGTAIVAAAALTAVGTAGAAGATVKKAPTTLTLMEQHAIIKPGQADLLIGTLLSGAKPVIGRAVTLDRLVAGKPVVVETRKTVAHGHVFFIVKPRMTTRYQVVFAGSPLHDGSRSNIATVVVVPPRAATQLSIVESKTSIKRGGWAVISGTLMSHRKALPGQRVWLCVIGKGRPACRNAESTNRLGRVFFIVRPGVTTRYQLRYGGSAMYLPTHSGVVTLVVK